MRGNPLFVWFKQLLVSLLKLLLNENLSQSNNSLNTINNSLIDVAESKTGFVEEPPVETLQLPRGQQQQQSLLDSTNQQHPSRYTRNQLSRLKEKCEEIQDEYDSLREKIRFLKNSQNKSDLSPHEGFILQQQIEHAEAERDKLSKQLDDLDQQIEKLDRPAARPIEELEKPPANEQLYQILRKLGYKEQVRTFRRLIKSSSSASFLIHGAPDYGQRWLLNRLVEQYVPYYMTGKVVKVNVSRRVRQSDINALWRELAERLGLRKMQVSPSEITERVYECWQTQNVLLVFDDVHRMPPDTFKELIYKFWLPLVEKTRAFQFQTGKYKLFMFLIDNEGCLESWEFPFTEELDLTNPYIPVRPKKIAEFSEEDLAGWIDNQYENLPPEMTEDDTVQAIVSNNNGIPEDVLKEICYRCGCDWYEELDKWLKL